MWDLALEFAAVIGWCWSTAEHLAWQSSSSFSSLRSAYTTSILGGGFVVTRFRLLFVCRAIFSSTHLLCASHSIAYHDSGARCLIFSILVSSGIYRIDDTFYLQPRPSHYHVYALLSSPQQIQSGFLSAPIPR